MREFSALCRDLEEAGEAVEQIRALGRYFGSAAPADAAWAVSLLLGKRFRAKMRPSQLRKYAQEVTGIDDWLFDECERAAGDVLATLAHLWPISNAHEPRGLAEWMAEIFFPLGTGDLERQRGPVQEAWTSLDASGRNVMNRLVTGRAVMRLARQRLIQGLCEATGLPVESLARRMIEPWTPDADCYRQLVSAVEDAARESIVADPCGTTVWEHAKDSRLHPVEDFLVTWLHDGVPVRIIKRNRTVEIWSTESELLTSMFPQFARELRVFPQNLVLDGDILDAEVESHTDLGERFPSDLRYRRSRASGNTARLVVRDVVECEGEDWRPRSLQERRNLLDALVRSSCGDWLEVEAALAPSSWDDVERLRTESRRAGATGIRLRRWESTRGDPGTMGDWVWSAAPVSLWGVLLYFQEVQDDPLAMSVEFTFGLWKNGALVPFGCSSKGLGEAEVTEIRRLLKEMTIRKYGPVRAVEPRLVFELEVDRIRRSVRRKSGLVAGGISITRWIREAVIADAHTIESVTNLLQPESAERQRQRPAVKRAKLTPICRQLQFEWRD